MGYKSKWTGEEIDSVLNSTLSRELSESQVQKLTLALFGGNTSLLTKEDLVYYNDLGAGDLYYLQKKGGFSISDTYSSKEEITFVTTMPPYMNKGNLCIDYVKTHLYLNSDGSVAGKQYIATLSLPAQERTLPQGEVE
jgi:hypothetical protein